VLSMQGIPMTPEEIHACTKMEEALAVFEVVSRIPEGLRDSFEHTTMELQIIITAATRIRTTVEKNNEAEILTLMEEESSSAFGQQTVKRAVLQAAQESAKIMRCKETWGKSSVDRIERLSHSAEIAEQTAAKLLVAEASLNEFAPEQTQKAKQAMMGFAAQNDDVTLRATIIAWAGAAQKEAGERRLREKMEKELEEAESELTRFKTMHLQNIRAVMERNARETSEEVLLQALSAWKMSIQDSKAELWNQEKVGMIEMMLAKKTKDKVEKAKQVMSRMLHGQTQNLVATCFQCWLNFLVEYKKDKEFEDSVKAAEQKMMSINQQKKDDAKAVLDKMYNNTSRGLLQTAFTGWLIYITNDQKQKTLDYTLNGGGGRLKSLQATQTICATGVQSRVNLQMDHNLLFRCVNAWQTESKANRIEKHYFSKIDNKRKQLTSVQMLFHSFAQELENGLKDIDGDSSGRGYSKRGSRRGLSKGDPQSVSLPDIHSRKA